MSNTSRQIALDGREERRLADYAHRVNIQHVLVWGGNMLFDKDLAFERDLGVHSLGRQWQEFRVLSR